MASSAVDFVPARYPESVRNDSSNYKIITPPQEEIAQSSSDASYQSKESSSDDSSSDDSSSDEDAQPNTAVQSEADTVSTQAKSDAPKLNTPSTITKFYDLNENPNDKGSRPPFRISKSWPPNAKKLVGLENQGVTCYQNAAVQAILHLPAIGQYLTEVLQKKHPQISNSSVTYVLAELFRKLQDKKSSVFPSKLLRKLDDINPLLNEWQQEDSHEYYMSLISRLQEDSVPKGEKLRSSIIHDIFGGSVEQRVCCQKCKHVSTTSQDFYDLPVSFSNKEKHNFTLLQSIKDFFSMETIDTQGKGNGYQCEHCKQQTKAVKQIKINEAPEYLTVHIKRFKMDGQISKKVKETLNYPIMMNLTEFETNPRVGDLQYKLIAVIMHEGRTVSSGHYIAFARHPNNEWVEYDDDYVKKVKESEIESNSSAYILIYSRLLAKQPERSQPQPQTQTQSQTQSQTPLPKRERENDKVQLRALKRTKHKELKQQQQLKSKKLEQKMNSKNLKKRQRSLTATPAEIKAAKMKLNRKSSEDIEMIFGKKNKKRRA